VTYLRVTFDQAIQTIGENFFNIKPLRPVGNPLGDIMSSLFGGGGNSGGGNLRGGGNTPGRSTPGRIQTPALD
jgi:hypothetical protein